MTQSPEGETRGGRLLILDDEPNVARVLERFFVREGWQVQTCGSPSDALAALAACELDVVLTDLAMPEMSGVELLREMRARGHQMPLLVITAYGTIDSAVEAMKLGAFDYLSKPFDLEKVKLAVQRAYLHGQLQQDNAQLRQELKQRYQFGSLVGSSRRMQEVYGLVERAAQTRANVLILGESGTGKELVARALHYNSPRSNRRFVPVSCAALPSELLESELFGHEKGAFTGANWQRTGRFELADGGTLFLDEIGDVSLAVQAKLLRAIQEREIDRVGGTKPIKVDVRLITATNRDLPEAIERGEFREDLYYRLRVLEIQLPPLRERREDIPLLVRHFLEQFARRDGKKLDGITAEALAVLEAYDWYGNVRELENAVEHAVALADFDATEVSVELLPRYVREPAEPAPAGPPALGGLPPLPQALGQMERTLLLAALERANWDMTAAARELGITPRAMRHTVRKHNLSGDRRFTKRG